MKKVTTYILVILLLSISFVVQAQSKKGNINNLDYSKTPYWIDMMKNLSVNFYDVQEAFNEYFKDRDKGKGSGWKQYKRWEYFMEQRVYPTGHRINHDQVWNEIKKFTKENSHKSSQTKNPWSSLGPATSSDVTGHWNPGIGRINVIALDPSDANTIYIGAPSGGLWKTTDEGSNWQVLTDDLPVLGVSAIAIHPTQTNTVYIGTGDKDASDNYSIGILKSVDGGITWDDTGLDWDIGQNRTIAKLLINPDNPDILFAATTAGLYKTVDAGVSWYNVLSGNIDDIEFKPGNPNVVYANTQSFYRSTDGGENFTYIAGVPGSSRSQIAVTEANPLYVYFFSYQSGVYRSTDNGLSFTMMSTEPNQGSQGWYDLAFAVSHTDADEVHLGEINTWKSDDGGQNWTKTTDWTWGNSIGYTHCDIHEMVFYGSNLYVGSDGLISKSTDGGDTWIDLTEGISIRQFYRIGSSQTSPYKILGGSQDNGTSVYSQDHWHEWLGADGMECVVDYTDNNIVYGTSQNGTFYKSNTGGTNRISLSQPGTGAWVTPFVIHPSNSSILFVGTSDVRKTIDGMQTWTTISNFGSGNINGIAIAESNPDYLYVSKSSTIYRTKNGGSNWTNISSGLPGDYISYITIHPEYPERIAVSISGFDSGEKVYISKDGGDSWENYSANLPNIPANCVIYNDDETDGIYVGMDVGVYYRDNTLVEWEYFSEGLPNVIVNELEISYDIGKIRAGTYGRGLWEADIHTVPPNDIDVSYTVSSGGDAIIEYGETVYLTVELTNNMESPAEDLVMSISGDESYINITDNNESYGTIAAGNSLIISDAFVFDANIDIPNDYEIILNTNISSTSKTWDGEIELTAFAPVIKHNIVNVNDGAEGILDPDETAIIEVIMKNTGGSSVSEIDVSFSTTDSYAQIDNVNSSILQLDPEASEQIQFDIIVDTDAPLGHIINISVDILATNGYTNTTTFGLTLGSVYEDFETNSFTKFPWKHSGDASFYIISDEVYEGAYAVKSSDITDSKNVELSVKVNVHSDDDISFYKKVSCEDDPSGTNYDYLAFLIDGNLQGSWDGEIAWSEETYPVSPGTHTFSWVYHKDQAVSEGSDCAWIDYIVFPQCDFISGIEQESIQSLELVKVFPNPFSGQTEIVFSLENRSRVSLDIYNINGQKVSTLISETEKEKGMHSVKWNGSDYSGKRLPQGIYFYKLYCGKHYTGSIILMR